MKGEDRCTTHLDPSFRFVYGFPNVFKDIGNALSTYINMDMSYVDTWVMLITRILILLEYREGLPKSMELKRGD